MKGLAPSPRMAMPRAPRWFIACAPYTIAPNNCLHRDRTLAGCVMLVQTSAGRSGAAHVIVVGNEKGGTGKSTIAMHLAVALLNSGQRVATMVFDPQKKISTLYAENRRSWSERRCIRLKIPDHFCVARGSTQKLDENEAIEFAGLIKSIAASELSHDFIVIDLPGT